jgi:hypothetical protein
MEAREPIKSFLYDTLLPKIEIISLLVAILGFAFKCGLVKGGDIMLLVGLSNLSIVYFLRAFAPLALITDEVNFPTQSIGRNGIGFSPTSAEPSFFLDILFPKVVNLNGAVVFMGVLFKLMNWRGGTEYLIVGVLGMLFVVLFSAFKQRINVRALTLGVISGIVLFVSPKFLIQQFHRDDSVLVEKMIYQLEHPRDRAAGEDVRQYLKQKRARR